MPASTHSRQNKHSTDADGDRGQSTLAKERHAVRRKAASLGLLQRKQRQTDTTCLYVCLLN